MSTPRIPVPFDDVFTSADLPQAGVSRGALQGWRARGEVVELGPGVFAPTPVKDLEMKRRIYPSRLIATGRQPVTIEGAALLHGLPLPPSVQPDWRRCRRVIPAQFLELRNGLVVPTVAWTAFNLARGQTMPDALIPLDAALRCGVGTEILMELTGQHVGRRGTRYLVRAVALADAKSESPLESKSRGLMEVAKIPRPELQGQITTPHGSFRVDFLWREAGLVGEADGRLKYDEPSTIWQEKRRQIAIEQTGLRVIRWGWTDVTTGREAWLRQIRRALGIHVRATRRANPP